MRSLFVSWCVLGEKFTLKRLRTDYVGTPEEMFSCQTSSRDARCINYTQFLLVSCTHKNLIMCASAVKSHNRRNIERVLPQREALVISSPVKYYFRPGIGCFLSQQRAPSAISSVVDFPFFSLFSLACAEISPVVKFSSITNKRQFSPLPVSHSSYLWIYNLKPYTIEYQR